MLAATIGFLLGSVPLLIGLLFLMGTQSTLFGPVKYAYLPQQLDASELVGGNALVGAGTYTAIILGLVIGGAAVDGTGVPLPQETIEACNNADAALLGAVGGPKWSDPNAEIRPEQGLLRLRLARWD